MKKMINRLIRKLANKKQLVIDIKVDNDNYIPSQEHLGDAGYDLCSTIDILLPAKERVVIPTGFYVDLPIGIVGMVCSRSGLAAKHGIKVLNAPGIIDEQFKNQIQVILYNSSNEDFEIKKGNRIAQFLFFDYLSPKLKVVDNLSEAKGTRKGGLGSSGI